MSLDPDTEQLADALHQLAKLYQFRSLDQRLYRTLTVSQSYCLRTLHFEGPQTMSSLAADLGVRLSTMTGVVDQLERKGLVERVNHPEDRRSLHVRTTARGRRLYQGGHEAFVSHLAPVLECRPAVDRTKLLALLADVTMAVRGWMESPRKAGRGKHPSR